MRELTKSLVVFTFLTCLVQPAFSQAKKDKSKQKEEVEKPPPPPPPQEELKDVRIIPDTTSSDVITEKRQFTDQDFFFANVDTIPPPNDELTTELRKLLVTTGAIDIGVQFAKAMSQEKDKSGLPAEFYDRFYKEISEGASKRHYENLVIKIYRKYYTLDDVKGLIVFYNSELGKKTLAMMPKVIEESQTIGAGFGQMLGMKIYNDLLKEGKIK